MALQEDPGSLVIPQKWQQPTRLNFECLPSTSSHTVGLVKLHELLLWFLSSFFSCSIDQSLIDGGQLIPDFTESSNPTQNYLKSLEIFWQTTELWMSVFQALLLLFTKVVVWRSMGSLMFNRLNLDGSEAGWPIPDVTGPSNPTRDLLNFISKLLNFECLSSKHTSPSLLHQRCSLEIHHRFLLQFSLIVHKLVWAASEADQPNSTVHWGSSNPTEKLNWRV